jgi:hypothetical protein
MKKMNWQEIGEWPMGYNLYLYEWLLAARQLELQREIEQMHMLASLPRRRVGKRAVARFGTLLVVLGTWLKRIEQGGEPALP